MSPRPAATGLVRIVFRLADLIGILGLIQIAATVFERAYLDGNTPILIETADDPVVMAAILADIREVITMTLYAGLISLAAAGLALALRAGRAWARVAMMIVLVAAALLYLIVLAVSNDYVLSGQLWGAPPDSLAFLQWYPPVHLLTLIALLVLAIAVSVMLFREPLKDFVHGHRPEAGANWDLSAVRERQARRTQ